MFKKTNAAIDLGASSGRIILSHFDGSVLSLEEFCRFPHSFVTLGERAYWDFLMLFEDIKSGLRKCTDEIFSLGIDTWGTDFGLLDRAGHLLSNPRSYRDKSYSKENAKTFHSEIANEKQVFGYTGISSSEQNTLFKLFLMSKEEDSALHLADKLLMMPNLFEYFFTGIKHTEFTIASTTQFYNMKTSAWAWPLIDKMDISRSLFTGVDYAGRNLGVISPSFAREAGHKNMQVISVAGHDTACAVAAVPCQDDEYTFLSSGTWSLLGICSNQILDSDEVYLNHLNNEGTYNGNYRPTFNIQGLWLLQELQRQWTLQGKNYSFPEMAEMAKNASCNSHIRVEDFGKRENLEVKISQYCKQTNQEIPGTDGAFVRCILESLTLSYKKCYNFLKKYITWPEKLYIVGGGTQNKLLVQFIADALGIPVICGATEASALGNIAMQLESCKEICGRRQFTELMNASFPPQVFEPHITAYWDDTFEKFLRLPADEPRKER